MRTSATVTCPSCDASWHVDDARFCGACGAHLQPSAPSEPDSVRRTWWRLAFGLVVTAALVGGAFAVGRVESFRLPPRGANPAVELDEDALTIEGAPLSDTERAEALAPFDEDRLRCEPEGCERWRIDAEDPGIRLHASVVGDVVLAVIASGVSAYDLDTGQQRWWTQWPDASDQPLATSEVVTLDEADAGVVVAAWPMTGHVMAVDLQGRLLWHGREDNRGSGYIAPAGDVVVAVRPSTSQVLVEEDGNSGDVFLQLDDLRVLDAATGDLLWDVEAVTMLAHVDGALVLHDGTTARLVDARTGEVRGRLPMRWGGWLQPADDVLVHAARDGAADTWQLLSADDLEVVAELGPLDLLQPSEDGSVLVGQVLGAGDAGDRVLLFEPDGRLRWEQALPFPAGSLVGCCTRPQVVGDTLHLPPRAGTTTPMQLDMADGSLRLTPPTQPGAAPAPTNAEGTTWVSPQTALSRAEGGEGETMLWYDGYRMAVRGGSYFGPATSEPPFVFAGWGSIIAVQPVPRD